MINGVAFNGVTGNFGENGKKLLKNGDWHSSNSNNNRDNALSASCIASYHRARQRIFFNEVIK